MRKKIILVMSLMILLLSGCAIDKSTSSVGNSSTDSISNSFVSNSEDANIDEDINVDIGQEELEYVIYLSPSVQEANMYADNLGSEAENMKAIAVILKEKLQARGFTVVSNDSLTDSLSLQGAVAESNSLQPDLHLALHSNASVNHTTSGLEVWYKNAEDKVIADAVYAELEKVAPTFYDHRGVKYTSQLYELNTTSAPACLAEILFHDESSQANWIVNNQEVIAEALFQAVLQYFNLV